MSRVKIPWLMAFRLEISFPRAEVGPGPFFAFSLFAAALAAVTVLRNLHDVRRLLLTRATGVAGER